MLSQDEMREKIVQIKKERKISNYDLALEIGISYSRLYNFLHPLDTIMPNIEEKIREYIENYKSKDDEINKLKKENTELKAENERLKEQVKHWQIEHKEGISKRDWAYEQRKKKSDKYKQTLQEIKEIAKEYKSGGFAGYEQILQKIAEGE